MAFTIKKRNISSIMLLLLIWSMIAFTILLVNVNGEHNTDDDEELDPFDMVNFDHASMKMRKKAPPILNSKPEGEKTRSAEEQRKDSSASARMEEPVPLSAHHQEDKTSEISKIGEEDKTSEINKPSKTDKTQPMAAESPKPKETCPALYLFQRFVTDLLKLIKHKVSQLDDKTELCLHLSLTPHQIEMLENFKLDHSKDRAFSTQRILSEALQGASVIRTDDSSFHSLWFEERFGIPVEKVVQVFFLVVLFFAFLLVLSKLRFSRNLVCWITFLGFLLSVATTWLRLYKGEVAKQHETMMKNPPSDCTQLPNTDSWVGSIGNMFKFYFTFQQDVCVEYYEHLLVDPIVKVSLMEAFAVAVVQTCLKPMRTIGMELSIFMRFLLKDLPAQWQLFTILAVFCFVVFVLLLLCGYRIRIPFLLAIEPSPRPSSPHIEGEEVRSLRQEVGQLQAKVEILGASGASVHQPSALPQAPSPKPALPETSCKDTTTQPRSGQERSALPLSRACSGATTIPERQADKGAALVGGLSESSCSRDFQRELKPFSEEGKRGSDSQASYSLSPRKHMSVPKQKHPISPESASGGAACSSYPGVQTENSTLSLVESSKSILQAGGGSSDPTGQSVLGTEVQPQLPTSDVTQKSEITEKAQSGSSEAHSQPLSSHVTNEPEQEVC